MARTRSRTGGGVARGLVLTAAVLLAGAATATVVLSEDAQTLRLAVVGALWAFVLAALAAPRRRDPAGAGEDGGDGAAGTELELRRTYEIELEREVAARREYELQLEVYLRRELERGLAEDVQTLRDEIERMRGEMMERLDGELRMERIETTRLIGGSLRALQDEARRLGLGLRVPEPAELTAGGYEPYPPPGDPGRYGDRSPGPYGEPSPGPYGEPSPGPYGEPSPGPYGDPGPGTDRDRDGEADPYGYLAADRPTNAVPSVPPTPLTPPTPPTPSPASPVVPAASGPPVPRPPSAAEMGPPRRRRYRDEGETNEVMSRLLGR